MASLAGARRIYVRAGFAFGTHSVVAARTGAVDLRVVDFGGWFKARCVMAQVAGIGAADVCGRFTLRLYAVMAGRAGSYNLRVVHA